MPTYTELNVVYVAIAIAFIHTVTPIEPSKCPGTNSPFYKAENPQYTIGDSAHSSVTFVLEKSLTMYNGSLVASSTFLNENGEIMWWHDFGLLEGPGWASNAVGGAIILAKWANITGEPVAEATAISLLTHVLNDGFIDWTTGLILGYRNTANNQIVANFKHNSRWFCPGSVAKIGLQLLEVARIVSHTNGVLAQRAVTAAHNYAHWLVTHVKPLGNGWIPRRVTTTGEGYPYEPSGGLTSPTIKDPLYNASADALSIIQLFTDIVNNRQLYSTLLHKPVKVDVYKQWAMDLTTTFIKHGGIFGSINQDTFSKHEDVAYAVAFRVLWDVAALFNNTMSAQLKNFAVDVCLQGLDQFKMCDDRNGVKTTGLLYMEKQWQTAYLWENAEVALAFFEAYIKVSAGKQKPHWVLDGLTILRAIESHHHGTHGFLTEGVDWADYVGLRHHFGYAQYGDIMYTEPLLNNLHHVLTWTYYIQNLATKHCFPKNGMQVCEWHDIENNLILSTHNGHAVWPGE